MQRISFSINKNAIETLQRLSKKTGLAQWKLVALGVRLLSAHHETNEIQRDKLFCSALNSIGTRHKKTFRNLAK